ncbi:hypothetical protein WDW89_24690 [Deltaproteobacteria bacterium TL4]
MKMIFILLCLGIVGRLVSASNVEAKDQYELIAYQGQGVDDDLRFIFTRQSPQYIPLRLHVLGINYGLDARIRQMTFEFEGNVAKYKGLLDHWEANALIIARYTFLKDVQPSSLAYGSGLSYATQPPVLHEDRPEPHLLNYLMIELDTGFLHYENLKLLARIHHRSGVFGFYCWPICGSNFLTYGIKVKF